MAARFRVPRPRGFVLEYSRKDDKVVSFVELLLFVVRVATRFELFARHVAAHEDAALRAAAGPLRTEATANTRCSGSAAPSSRAPRCSSGNSPRRTRRCPSRSR